MALLKRLQECGSLVVAEGYLWEFERRGYVRFGEYTPLVVLKYPEMVRMMHREFAHAGSDVIVAYTYLGNRKKMKDCGYEDSLEQLNRQALKIAREVADEFGCLMAGDISHSWLYDSQNKEAIQKTREMFREQVEWAVEEGADYIIAETFETLGEAMLALETIKTYGKGLPAVITLTAYQPDKTLDDFMFPDACHKLEKCGASIVGINCSRGPETMLPLIRQIKKSVQCPVAALPVPFRCRGNQKTLHVLRDPDNDNKSVYPDDLCSQLCTRTEIRKFAYAAKELGIQYIGLCCGNCPSYLREVAQIYGRHPPACEFLPDMTKSQTLGTDPKYAKLQAFLFDACEST